MIIRKEFRVESAHIVRNCTSERCSHSIHGHSAVIEVFFEGTKPDNAGMLIDFGLMKTTIKSFIDSMDHCYLLWSKDKEEFKKFIKENCDRWIELPFNPSAENLAVWLHGCVDDIIGSHQWNNGEDPTARVKAVRYHETTTGYAKSSIDDVYKNKWIPHELFKDIEYSSGVIRDWSPELKEILINGNTIVNPKIEQQVV